jgi:transcription elongation factor Elf1
LPAGKSPLRDALVKRSQAAENPYKCPACGNPHVVLDGKYERKFRKEFSEGVETGVEIDPHYVERYTAIGCYVCGMRAKIEPDHIVDLYVENMDLKMELGHRTGAAVEMPSKQQVM